VIVGLTDDRIVTAGSPSRRAAADPLVAGRARQHAAVEVASPPTGSHSPLRLADARLRVVNAMVEC
jgi:hypothetical protein